MVETFLTNKRNNYIDGYDDRDDDFTRESFPHEEISGLVDDAAGGNTQSFGRLYTIYHKKIYHYILYQVRNVMIAEDITADVFVKVIEKIDTCRGKGPSFTGWIYRIARNRIIDYFRHNKRRLALETDDQALIGDETHSPFKEAERKELLGVISALPDIPRQVIILKFIIGLRNDEIAQVIGKSPGAIRIIQMRALATLRKKLES